MNDYEILLLLDPDLPEEKQGEVVGRVYELWHTAPEKRYGVVIGGATADEARALWNQGDICLIARVEWI